MILITRIFFSRTCFLLYPSIRKIKKVVGTQVYAFHNNFWAGFKKVTETEKEILLRLVAFCIGF
jgi:hypothetical protein